ncbi:MAG: right-handed parallel beta-helix repeat-containing protein [Phycisphaerales bacterium]
MKTQTHRSNRALSMLAALAFAAGAAHAAEFTVPGPLGEGLAFYLESPISPVQPGDTITLTDAGFYQDTYVVSDADLIIRGAPGQDITVNGQFVDTVFTLAANNITFENLTITGGLAAIDGGAIRAVGFDLTVRDCRFENNLAPDDAGAIVFSGGVMLVEDCEFINNSTQDSTVDSSGGAIQIVRGQATIRRSTFSGNTSFQGGGAIQFVDSDADHIVEDCVFTGNSSGRGGAMWWLSGAEGTVADTLFDGNTATTTDGGAVDNSAAPATYERCVFVNNQALGEDGGAIYIAGETSRDVALNQCVIANNTAASNGGAITMENGPDPIILNCTIVDNSSLTGGGVSTLGGGTAGRFRNVIMRGNTPDQFAGPIVFENSNIEGGATSPDVIISTNVIDAPAMFVDPSNGDYRLMAGSPSIDAGDANFYSEAANPVDFDGNARAVTNDAGIATGLPLLGLFVDQGAFEFQPETSGPGCSPADIAAPFGVLNFFDVAAYIAEYNSGCP